MLRYSGTRASRDAIGSASVRARAAAVPTHAMPRERKNALPPGGTQGAGGAAAGESGRGGGTSTTQPLAETFSPATTPSVALASPEQEAAFCQAVVDYLGIKPACKAVGLKSAAVFYWANTHPTFREKLKAAQAAEAEDHAYRIRARNDELLAKSPQDMNLCANAYRIANEQDMRMLGKLNASLYGDKPGTQVNIQNNTGIVCDEETRARLIALNQKLLTAGSETKQLEQ